MQKALQTMTKRVDKHLYLMTLQDIYESSDGSSIAGPSVNIGPDEDVSYAMYRILFEVYLSFYSPRCSGYPPNLDYGGECLRRVVSTSALLVTFLLVFP